MLRLFAVTVLTVVFIGEATAQSAVSGVLRQWHRVTITFDGPQSAETAETNPFRDCRLDVTFSKDGQDIVVPGYYAADGNAGESGATAGDRWRVHFAPDEPGTWAYRASFRVGRDVAASEDATAGKPAGFAGAAGTLVIEPTDKAGRDHRAQGLLRYVGGHYLQFATTGDFFLKGGADSPENFLAYFEFDGVEEKTTNIGEPRKGEAPLSRLHKYEPHARDWQPGDPTWQGGKGKNIIGALNYLASKGMNSVYFLTMNVGGDGKDVWPWIDPKTQDRYDC
ncbi:MAG TPA: DUF5060 domain-containing protein, partial [Thermoguttaceae bacterium]|nr:DUF5060 domain-containing protein [Thermoguttaceae bacterium]